jgi:hypothetical protein
MWAISWARTASSSSSSSDSARPSVIATILFPFQSNAAENGCGCDYVGTERREHCEDSSVRFRNLRRRALHCASVLEVGNLAIEEKKRYFSCRPPSQGKESDRRNYRTCRESRYGGNLHRKDRQVPVHVCQHHTKSEASKDKNPKRARDAH